MPDNEHEHQPRLAETLLTVVDCALLVLLSAGILVAVAAIVRNLIR